MKIGRIGIADRLRQHGAALMVLFIATIPTADAAGSKQRLDRTVTFVNGRDSTLTYLYVSAVTDEYWGPDHLGHAVVLKAGEQATIDFNDGTTQCLFDIMVKFLDGTITEQRSVNLCEQHNIVFE